MSDVEMLVYLIKKKKITLEQVSEDLREEVKNLLESQE